MLDGHPAAHAWLGAVRGQRVVPLGVDHFGQAGDIPDLYREYGLDTDAILDACAAGAAGLHLRRRRAGAAARPAFKPVGAALHAATLTGACAGVVER